MVSRATPSTSESQPGWQVRRDIKQPQPGPTVQFFYGFGTYRLFPDGLLLKRGRTVSIPPKELALLRLLVRQSGQVVSHQEIEEAIWPRQQISYASISRCVYSLRKLLGKGSDEFIETLPKRGYRFSKPVEKLPDHEISSVFSRAASAKPLAISHFVEGLAEANRTSFGSQQRAIELFEEADRVEGGFAAALGAIAECHMYQSVWSYIPARKARQLIANTCDRALQLDGKLVSALGVKAWATGVLDRDFETGLDLIQSVLEIDNTYAKAYAFQSWILRAAGRVKEALAAAEKARKLDPHSQLIKHAVAWGKFCAGKPEEAFALEKLFLKNFPGNVLASTWGAIMAAYLGKQEEAIEMARFAHSASGFNPAVATSLIYALAMAGRQEEAESLVRTALEKREPATVLPHLAMAYVAMDKPGTAVWLLLKAHESGCPWAPCALADPRLGSLANDPRLACLRNRRTPSNLKG